MSKTTRITTSARAFNEAGSDLATAMLEQLHKEDLNLTAELAQVLKNGERMVLALEISPAAPSIWWATIDDH